MEMIIVLGMRRLSFSRVFNDVSNEESEREAHFRRRRGYIHRGSAESRPFFLSFYYQGKHHCESDKKRWNIDSGADKWESGRGGT